MLSTSLGGRTRSAHATQQETELFRLKAEGSGGSASPSTGSPEPASSRLVEPESSGESIGTFQALPADLHRLDDGTGASRQRQVVGIVIRHRQVIGFA